MGQNLSNQLEDIKGDVIKEAHNIKEVIDISHEDLLAKLCEVNQVLEQAGEVGNSKLEFKIKEGSDTTFLWKQTIRIICVRHLKSPAKEIIFKQLNLRQFLLGHKMILYHMTYKQTADVSEGAHANEPRDISKQFSASMILDQIALNASADVEECIICMERKPEITLPCAHAYCLFCIEQWNVSNKTCPVCRTRVENTDDSWVTPDIPDSSEINAEVQKALTKLTYNLPDDDDDD